ncbi:hypothetical protein IWW37_000685, partial [Coemansia sp. RSA 2050]
MDSIIAYIDKFDGNGNFTLWKSHVYLVLHAKGVAHAVENDLRYDDGNGNFVFDIDDSKADGTASIIIRSCLAPEYTNYNMNLKAFELWAELDMLFSLAKTSKIVAQLSKLLACKMQPGDKNRRTFAATFKSIVQAMDSSDLSYDQLVTLIYLSSLNDEFRPVATHFGTIKPTLFTLQKVAIMVCEHTDTLMTSVDQDSSVFAGASQNNVVCQYCLKSGYTADKCFAIANLKNKPKADSSSSSSSSSSSNSSGGSKKPHVKSEKNTFSVKVGGISVLAAHAASSLLDRLDAWLLGSGANASSCNLRDLFTELQGYSGKIMTM